MDKAETLVGGLPGVPERLRASPLLSGAYELAGAAHAGQSRKDGSPYIEHPEEVTAPLAAAGFDDEVLAAAMLHDVVEHGDVELDEVEEHFGERVTSLVAALTEDEAIDDYVRRKRAQRQQVKAAGREAIAIFVADKLANVRDVRRAHELAGEAVGRHFEGGLDARVQLWREDLETAVEVAPELPFLRDLRYEIESFEEQRAKGASQ